MFLPASRSRSGAPEPADRGITPAAAEEVIFLMRRAFETHDAKSAGASFRRSAWNSFVHRYIGHRGVLQVAVMFNRFDPEMASICCTVQRLRSQVQGRSQTEHATSAPLPGSSPAAGAPLPGSRVCERCDASVPSVELCWLCGQAVCLRCCINRDTRCKEIDGCRTCRQQQLDSRYGSESHQLCGLWLRRPILGEGKGTAPQRQHGHADAALNLAHHIATAYATRVACEGRTM